MRLTLCRMIKSSSEIFRNGADVKNSLVPTMSFKNYPPVALKAIKPLRWPTHSDPMLIFHTDGHINGTLIVLAALAMFRLDDISALTWIVTPAFRWCQANLRSKLFVLISRKHTRTWTWF